MKSMSIVAQGRSRLNCVWRCAQGLRSAVSPAIHILAGENVCIQKTSPAQFGALLASRHAAVTSSGRVTTALHTTRAGT
jgi:hypothetical protein